MSGLRHFVRDERGASAAEFAMVLPLLLIFLLGLIDTGRFMWEHNRAEKATQMGVRYAVVTDPVIDGLDSYSFATDGGIAAGDPVPTSSFDSATCTSSGCTCQPGGDFCSGLTFDSAAFANMVARMSAMYPSIARENVEIHYRNVGLGYAGDPYGPDVSALVTVRLTNMAFQPLSTLIFGTDLGMPDFRASLTLEDGSGNVSN